MIATLRGNFLFADATSVVIECAGVGYRCFVTKNTLYNLPPVNQEMFLYTHLAVREDAMDLYGFTDLDELNTFKLITSVNGVGAKLGIAILSEFTPSQLILSIAGNDPKRLTAAAGVGIKLAQRIVLELKDKVSDAAVGDSIKNAGTSRVTANVASGEAIEALVALGYSKSDAASAIGRLDETLPADELIKQALKVLARRL